MDPLIKFKDVSVIYDLGKSNETKALDKASFEIYPGEYVIFFGPSGCGKSTILYTIAGLEFPTHGTVEALGKQITSLTQKELEQYHRFSVGMIFQAYYLISSLSILHNALLPRLFWGKDGGASRKADALSFLRRFGIENLAHRLPRALSGGQQQRAAIARALINDPPIILADEPVGNLDSQSAENVMQILYDLNQKDKKVVILVTHDPRFLKYAHRIYHLSDGRIVQEVVNYEKQQIIEKKATERVPTQLEHLARLYPYLSQYELKARALTNYLLSDFSADIQERIESAIGDFIEGKISREGLLDMFDRRREEGGIGLYRQTASDLGGRIETILLEAQNLRGELGREREFPERPEVEVNVERMRRHLMDLYRGTIVPEQLARLEKALKARILGALNGKMFEEYLDRPLKKGGVGLNRRTARNFTREVEIIIAEAE